MNFFLTINRTKRSTNGAKNIVSILAIVKKSAEKRSLNVCFQNLEGIFMRRKNTSEVEQKKEQAGVRLKNFNCMPFFSLNYVAFLLSGFTFSSEFEILHIWWSVIAFLIRIQRPFRYSHQVDLAPLNFYYCVNIAYYTSI